MAKAPPLIRELPFDLRPLGGAVVVSQGWGGDTSHGKQLYHSLDFVVPFGTKLYAMGDGIIVDLHESIRDGGARSSPSDVGDSGIGNFITVKYSYLDIYVTYAHLKHNSIPVSVGDRFETGDLLGQIGNTGYRTGTHLHMQMGIDDVDWRAGRVADGSERLGTPAVFDTATGQIEPGVVSEVSYDLGRSGRLGPEEHNLTLMGSRSTDGYGDAWANIISGNSRNNHIDGRGGNDTLSGGRGNDTLVGGVGADRLAGGSGADRFVFNSASDSGTTRSSRDVITDFGRDDFLDLRLIDANSLARGDQSFSYIGSAKFGRQPGELRFEREILEGDVNGDGRADFQIELIGVDRLFASDLIL